MEFWAAWPKKVAKPTAARAFAKVDPSPELLSKILASVAAQSRTEKWLKDSGEYIPHPSTWLNQRRWEDEAATPKPAERAAEPAPLREVLAAATANGPPSPAFRRGGDA